MSSTIPESLKARIQKLLALANDSRGNENEAASASAKVQALLAQYNLEMSDVQESDDATIDNPDAEREKSESVKTSATQWQVDLMASLARNNFCLHWTRTTRETGRGHGATRAHSLIGRRVNVTTTIQTYEYLTATMERLNPYADKRTISHRSWHEGCAARVAQRLAEQRAQSEAQSRQATHEAPRGNGRDVVLSDIYSSEEDLNRDMRWGYAPGTTARQRIENAAYWEMERAKRAAEPVREEPKKFETDAQRRKREEKETAESRWHWERYERRRAKEEARIDRNAYAMGDNAGNQIGLNSQIGHGAAHDRIR